MFPFTDCYIKLTIHQQLVRQLVAERHPGKISADDIEPERLRERLLLEDGEGIGGAAGRHVQGAEVQPGDGVEEQLQQVQGTQQGRTVRKSQVRRKLLQGCHKLLAAQDSLGIFS